MPYPHGPHGPVPPPPPHDTKTCNTDDDPRHHLDPPAHWFHHLSTACEQLNWKPPHTIHCDRPCRFSPGVSRYGGPPEAHGFLRRPATKPMSQSSREISHKDRAIVDATDGLWTRMSNRNRSNCRSPPKPQLFPVLRLSSIVNRRSADLGSTRTPSACQALSGLIAAISLTSGAAVSRHVRQDIQSVVKQPAHQDSACIASPPTKDAGGRRSDTPGLKTTPTFFVLLHAHA